MAMCSIVCSRRDLNPHAYRHRFLRPACLPISPQERSRIHFRRMPARLGVAFRDWTMVGAAGLAPATSSSRNWRSSLSELRSVHGRPAGSCTPILRSYAGYPGCWTTGRWEVGGRGRTRTFIGRVRTGYAALHHAPDVGATGVEPACFRLVLQRYRLPHEGVGFGGRSRTSISGVTTRRPTVERPRSGADDRSRTDVVALRVRGSAVELRRRGRPPVAPPDGAKGGGPCGNCTRVSCFAGRRQHCSTNGPAESSGLDPHPVGPSG